MKNHFHYHPMDRTLNLFHGLRAQVMICVLHARIRIVENLLTCTFNRTRSHRSQTELELITTITNRIRQTPQNSQFAFRKEEKKTIVEKQYADAQPLSIPFMNGPQVDSLLEHFETVFDGYMRDDEKILWKMVRVVLQCHLNGTEKMLALPAFNIKYQRQLCRAIPKLMVKTYPSQHFAHYSHMVFIHSADLREKYQEQFGGSLVKFSNEGLESHHNGLHHVHQHGTNDSGGRSPVAAVVQIMLHSLRKLYTTVQYNLPWNFLKQKTIAVVEDKLIQKYEGWINQTKEHVNWILHSSDTDFNKRFATISGATKLPSILEQNIETDTTEDDDMNEEENFGNNDLDLDNANQQVQIQTLSHTQTQPTPLTIPSIPYNYNLINFYSSPVYSQQIANNNTIPFENLLQVSTPIPLNNHISSRQPLSRTNSSQSNEMFSIQPLLRTNSSQPNAAQRGSTVQNIPQIEYPLNIFKKKS